MNEPTNLQHASPASESGQVSSMLDLYVSCDVCQHEIPLSAAISPESSDYVVYFCGLECYEKWRNQTARL